MPLLWLGAEEHAAALRAPHGCHARRCSPERALRARPDRHFLKRVRPDWTDVLAEAPCAPTCGLYLSRMARRSIDCRIRVDGMPARSETILTEAGPNALVLSTTLRDRGIWIDSTYLGHGGTDTQITHLLVAPGRPGETEARAVAHDEGPVIDGRRLCLYDHLQRLQDFLDSLGHTAQVHGLDLAIEAVEQYG